MTEKNNPIRRFVRWLEPDDGRYEGDPIRVSELEVDSEEK